MDDEDVRSQRDKVRRYVLPDPDPTQGHRGEVGAVQGRVEEAEGPHAVEGLQGIVGEGGHDRLEGVS